MLSTHTTTFPQAPMPNTKSAKKRMRQSLVRRTRNRAAKGAIKTQVQKTRAAIVAGNVQSAEGEFRLAAKRLDKAAAAGIIHPNHAARVKSRLSAALKTVKAK
jgi:small subunit ribosomal protein S20